MKNTANKFYHYTSIERLEEIITSQEIRQATAFVAKKEKPIAWVSSNQTWENTATKSYLSEGIIYPLTFAQQQVTCGCARIEVSSKGLHTWGKLKHIAKIKPDTVSRLEVVGLMKGSKPSEWFGSLVPIKWRTGLKLKFTRMVSGSEINV
ncbi:hypothetical protein ACRASX_08850 [Flavobacterium sp. TMP13]|uniref:hypothetical protein n=1 Tax=Flavobacterium sp. TMP13 TaxID=3425950 RepID=UPI003D77777F